MRAIRNRLTYANVVASIALFAALGGTSYAAVKVSGKNIKNNAVASEDIRNNSVRSKDVRNNSLLAKDFKSGQLPSGPPGATGAPGPRGPQGLRGVQGVAGAPATRLLAVVAEDCSSVIRSRGVVGISLSAPSRCDVRFDRDVSGCFPVVSGKDLDGYIDQFAVGTDEDNLENVDANEVMVRYANPDGSTDTDRRPEFSLAVFC